MPAKQSPQEDTRLNRQGVYSKGQRQRLLFRASSFFINTVGGLFLLVGVYTDDFDAPLFRLFVIAMCAFLIPMGIWHSSRIVLDLVDQSICGAHGRATKLQRVRRRGPTHYNVEFEGLALRALDRQLWDSVEFGKTYQLYFTERSRFLLSLQETPRD